MTFCGTLIPIRFFLLNRNIVACRGLIRQASSCEYPSILLIEAILSSKDKDEIIRRLPGDDAQVFIDVIDKARFIFT